jgi:5-methylcytosine-specific restriction endonuclease McrA
VKRDKEYLKWRENVLKRDGYQCVICKAGPKHLNAHHLIPKNFKEYALNVDNGLTLCPTHHTLGKFSAHKNPLWFGMWLRKYDRNKYEMIMRRIQWLK